MELRCLVADDEPIARKIVENYISQVPYLQLVASCKNAFEVIEILQRETIDLLFLDINMPKLSGMSLLRSLAHRPAVIVTTAYPEHAVESFELSVSDYLLKPFSLERFLQAVGKIQQQRQPTPTAHLPVTAEPNSPTHQFVKVDKRIVRIEHDQLRHVEAYGNYIKLHMGNETLLVSQTLSGFQERLPEAEFIQVHKSYVVNIQHIKSLEGNQLMVDDTVLPVGKSHQANVLLAMGLR